MNDNGGLYILDFAAPEATTLSLVGGKGANLGVLTRAGFPVPRGFTITTDACASFLAATAIADHILTAGAGLDYEDAQALERVTGEIRNLTVGAEMPDAVAAEIAEAYRALGDEPHVAVRSSATTEDLAGTSFAGLHDTYLDIKGVESVLQAVKRCWASLWNARAAAYRSNNRVDHPEARMAVVVQVMVESDVSGVMFTGNPLTAATDEVVINASWGLGEAVVSGIVTPDEYTVQSTNVTVLERTLGSKEHEIVRDPTTGRGTVQREVASERRAAFALSDEQLVELAEIGLRVQAHYDEMPQDIEWGISKGRIYMLQARPITGVEFSWDAEIDAATFPWAPNDPEIVWTRAFADTYNPGAMTPLTYSTRYGHVGRPGCGWPRSAETVGIPELDGVQVFKFWKGYFYYNTAWERKFVERSALPLIRPFILDFIHPAEAADIRTAPFEYERYAQFLIKVLLFEPERGPIGNLRRLNEYWRNERFEDTGGLSKAELQKLSDVELRTYVDHYVDLERQYNADIAIGFQIWFRDAHILLERIVDNWYDGDNPAAYAHLISGSFEQTDTQIENEDLWRFAEKIRNTDALLRAFREADGEAPKFFAGLEKSEEGRAFLEAYGQWSRKYEHRGESDRDMVYPRRGDDPFVDYKVFQSFLGGEEFPVAPEVLAMQTEERQRAAYDEVLTNIRMKPFGELKAMVFKAMFWLVRQWIMARDNERQQPTDRIMYQFMRGFEEMGRRLHERGLTERRDDHLYLAQSELYELFDGRVTNMTLLNAKIAARRRDVTRILEGQRPLKFLYRNRGVDLSPEAAQADGRFQGKAMSHGSVTGTARVVPVLAGIGRIKKGEILVTTATDPGWTPVFLLLAGVVTETGGLMSHASCLAREYGFPAVQLEDAMALIPDGAAITLDGDTGQVIIVDTDGGGDGTDVAGNGHTAVGAGVADTGDSAVGAGNASVG